MWSVRRIQTTDMYRDAVKVSSIELMNMVLHEISSIF